MRRVVVKNLPNDSGSYLRCVATKPGKYLTNIDCVRSASARRAR